MSTTQQPEALRLARKFEEVGFMGDHRFAKDRWCRQAAAELRHQHERIEELEAQLSAIGAGGVEPLRKQASTADVADERDAFDKWLRIAPCGAAHDFGWQAWKARAALAFTPVAGELATLQAGLQAAAPNAPLYDPREVAFSAQAAPQAVQAAVPEAIEQMAVDRYKVVPSHESMFHRWAVVAGNGTQQLYIGREVECLNMARKFAGAFLDGAFVAMQNAAPPTKRASRWCARTC